MGGRVISWCADSVVVQVVIAPCGHKPHVQRLCTASGHTPLEEHKSVVRHSGLLPLAVIYRSCAQITGHIQHTHSGFLPLAVIFRLCARLCCSMQCAHSGLLPQAIKAPLHPHASYCCTLSILPQSSRLGSKGLLCTPPLPRCFLSHGWR